MMIKPEIQLTKSIDTKDYKRIYFNDVNGRKCCGFFDDNDLIGFFPLINDYDKWLEIINSTMTYRTPKKDKLPKNIEELENQLEKVYDNAINMFVVKNSLDFYIENRDLNPNNNSIKALLELVDKTEVYSNSVLQDWANLHSLWRDGSYGELIYKGNSPYEMYKDQTSNLKAIYDKDWVRKFNVKCIAFGTKQFEIDDVSTSIISKDELIENNDAYHNNKLINIVNFSSLKAKKRILN